MSEHDPSPDFDFPTPSIDPNSPERQKAAKFAVAYKVCLIIGFACIGLGLICEIILQAISSVEWIFAFLPAILLILLGGIFKDKELKLRCTARTTAFCIDTVRRRSGKTSVRHPIVEYEVKGVTYTAELQVSCSRNSVGETFPIDYDPLDPKTVRTKRGRLFK